MSNLVRRLLCIWCITISSLCNAISADTPVVIPDGVHYKKADPDLNDKISGQIQTALAAGPAGVGKLFTIPCVCAPGYWAMAFVKQRPDVTFPNGSKTNFTIPSATAGKDDKLVGETLKEPADLALLAKCLAEDAGPKPLIRKMTAKEISLLWALYPTDLEEPIFVLENKDRHFAIVLTRAGSGKYAISWVDELSSYSHS